jgi:hypothetical protein
VVTRPLHRFQWGRHRSGRKRNTDAPLAKIDTEGSH